jgi:hypothetical protein
MVWSCGFRRVLALLVLQIVLTRAHSDCVRCGLGEVADVSPGLQLDRKPGIVTYYPLLLNM